MPTVLPWRLSTDSTERRMGLRAPWFWTHKEYGLLANNEDFNTRDGAFGGFGEFESRRSKGRSLSRPGKN